MYRMMTHSHGLALFILHPGDGRVIGTFLRFFSGFQFPLQFSRPEFQKDFNEGIVGPPLNRA
jgi:hypothetical protein